MVGYTTDVVGFLKSIQSLGASLDVKVLMLGCGGVAQMMGAETILAGGKLTVAVRDVNSQKATDLVSLLKNIKADAIIDSLELSHL